MNETFKLGDRLQKCANYVPFGAKLVDIGTDHGYLPIWLLKNEKIKSAIAADINADPLASAVKNAKKYNVNLTTVLSNGFESINESDFDCAVIAGMGGDLISNIIENAKFLKNENINLILQPMSKASKLRQYLWDNGFYIKKEETVKHKGKIYSVLLVSFGQSQKLCEFMGAIEAGSEYSQEYACSVLNDLKNSLNGLHGESFEQTQNKIQKIEKEFLTYAK